MNLFKKKIAISVLCLGEIMMASSTANAFWPFTRAEEDSQTCKAKFDKCCDVVEDKESVCHKELADLYSIIDRLTSDIRDLKSSQLTAESIQSQLTVAYNDWQKDDFRIDTQQHTNYVLLKKKFADQNRFVEQNEQLVKGDIKIISGLLDTQLNKGEYTESLKNAIDAYYRYTMAVAKEDIDHSEQ